jgi:hypothetical protein
MTADSPQLINWIVQAFITFLFALFLFFLPRLVFWFGRRIARKIDDRQRIRNEIKGGSAPPQTLAQAIRFAKVLGPVDLRSLRPQYGALAGCFLAFIFLLCALFIGSRNFDLNSKTTPIAIANSIATGVAGTLTAQAQQSAYATLVVTSATATAPAVYYNLVLRYSKNCLSVQGSQAVEATCNQSSQLWNLPTDTTGGYFHVELENSGNCLSASSNHETDPVILKNCRGSDDQLWQKRLSGGYFQLVNKTQLAEDPTNMCLDARQWGQPIMQWPCKPWHEDYQLDNQLLCQSTTNADTCTQPPGVYVTSIQIPTPYSDPDKPNTFHVFFNVTFNNTTGTAQSYSWFVTIFGKDGGQTPQQTLAIPPGITTIAVGPWNIGRTCTADYTAKAVWRRPDDGPLFAFKDPNGREYSTTFQLCP